MRMWTKYYNTSGEKCQAVHLAKPLMGGTLCVLKLLMCLQLSKRGLHFIAIVYVCSMLNALKVQQWNALCSTIETFSAYWCIQRIHTVH